MEKVRTFKSVAGLLVMHEDYEILKERCAALAEENLVLREYRPQPSGAAMMEALDAFYEYPEDVQEQGMMAAFEILCCKRPVTPATDALLDEVRAQGVEIAIDRIQETGSLTFGDCYVALHVLVDELRKGVQS